MASAFISLVRSRSVALVLAPALAVLSCSQSDSGGQAQISEEDALELISWWSQAGEREALDELLKVYAQVEPAVAVARAPAKDSDTARNLIRARMQTGVPPDSFQAISGSDLMDWVDADTMEPITELAEENGWWDVFPAAVIETLSRDEKLYAVPVNIERDNNLYYNVALFNKHELEPPRSLEDFFSVCEALQSKGIVPLAIPAEDWVLALVAFETLMPAVSGGQYYQDFLRGNVDPRGPELRAFFEELAKVLSCSNVTDAKPGWSSAADLVYSADAAMLVMGDWAKGYFEGGKDAQDLPRKVWQPRRDFDVVPGLGSEGYYTFNSAVFGLPQGVQHHRAAKAFLEVVGSKEGQEAFNPVKGSVPARIDADLRLFDGMVQDSAADFAIADRNGKLLPGYASLAPLDFTSEISPSLLVFAVGGDRARSLDVDKKIPEDEVVVPALDVDYMIEKIAANYWLLRR
jgi:glucose/mannose transport system substrate-binding protein